MTLSLPIPRTIPSAKLANNTRSDYAGVKAMAIGWGYTQVYLSGEKAPSTKISNPLKKVDLTIMSAITCYRMFKKQFPTDNQDYTEGGTMICAGGENKRGVCEVIIIYFWLIIRYNSNDKSLKSVKFDIGGPLLLVNGVQVGITSNVDGCGDRYNLKMASFQLILLPNSLFFSQSSRVPNLFVNVASFRDWIKQNS